MTNPSSNRTIFEKIVAREIPADIWYEDDSSLAFLDINPVSAGHSLYITKHPYTWIQDLPADVAALLFSKVPMLVEQLKSVTNADYVQLAVMGLDVPHFHLHLIPRMFGDDHNELRANPELDYDRAVLVNKLINR